MAHATGDASSPHLIDGSSGEEQNPPVIQSEEKSGAGKGTGSESDSLATADEDGKSSAKSPEDLGEENPLPDEAQVESVAQEEVHDGANEPEAENKESPRAETKSQEADQLREGREAASETRTEAEPEDNERVISENEEGRGLPSETDERPEEMLVQEQIDEVKRKQSLAMVTVPAAKRARKEKKRTTSAEASEPRAESTPAAPCPEAESSHDKQKKKKANLRSKKRVVSDERIQLFKDRHIWWKRVVDVDEEDEWKYLEVLRESGMRWTVTELEPYMSKVVREFYAGLPSESPSDSSQVFVVRIREAKVRISPRIINETLRREPLTEAERKE
ncbi:retinitis pigmentosa 1-like 1 protein [Eutrema salsugineum]|uniref:retinitis pigmentosa 1-like 1 protein n=1 Tax=Eutrema salsugineum TaxID=72664 RepID=UPI000CED39D8|nr:retinitis pigmentosa 1-like 1 protein [Eutrema salsugineum]